MTEFPRRDFLKIGAAGVGGVTLKSVFSNLYGSSDYDISKTISRTTRRNFSGFPTTCHSCPAKCGIVGFVHRSKLMLLEGNPEHPENQGKICARGLAGLNLTYDPERILFPLRRDGKRGSGKWKQISWEEAISEISAKLKDTKKSGNPAGLIIESETDDLLADRFIRAFKNGFYAKCLPDADPNSLLAHRVSWGAGTGIPDVSNSSYILMFGANPYENFPHFIGFVRELMHGRLENGAKLVVFDPRLSHTAAGADEWLPLSPGSDAFVALTLTNLILNHNLADETFVRQWTNISIGELKQYLSQFTAEKAEQVSGIKADDLRRIAQKFGRADKPVAFGCRGISAQQTGVQNQRAILLLNAVVGAIDKKGGYCLPAELPQLPELEPLPLQQSIVQDSSKSHLHHILDGEIKLDVYLSHLHNPVFTGAQPEEMKKLLKDETKISFHVAMDTHLTESASLADIFLPAATYLERWNIQFVSGVKRVPILTVTRPVVQPVSEQITLKAPEMTRRDMLTTFFQPLGQARSIDEMCLLLSQKLGGNIKTYFNFYSTREYVRRVAAQIDGFNFEKDFRLLEQQGFWITPGTTASYLRFEKNGFATPSRKFEIRSTELQKMGDSALPVHAKNLEHPTPDSEELLLITFSRNVMSSRLANCKYLSEIAHDNPLWIHPETAKIKGINKGDSVKLQTAVGKITVNVRLTESIHPQAVALARDFGHWSFGNVALAKKFKSADPDTDILWWEDEGNGVHVNSIVSRAVDSVGGGQVWSGIRVKVLKV